MYVQDTSSRSFWKFCDMASLDTKDIDVDAPTKVDAFQRPGGIAANMSPERRAQVEKKLKRKLDARCSLFVLIYIMNYLDRNNIAAARLGGLQEDLNINNTQYATCLSILYVGYICKYTFPGFRERIADNF
jgi:hypothetical protein